MHKRAGLEAESLGFQLIQVSCPRGLLYLLCLSPCPLVTFVEFLLFVNLLAAFLPSVNPPGTLQMIIFILHMGELRPVASKLPKIVAWEPDPAAERGWFPPHTLFTMRP